MKSIDYHDEERNREPSQFGISMNTSELVSWRKAATIEVIEIGVRRALDLSQTRSLKKLSMIFELLTCLHKMLLNPLNPVCESVLSSCTQSKGLAEIIAYILLNNILQLSLKADINSEKYASTIIIAKEMCVCLATALPDDLHILDETLSILFYSKNPLRFEIDHFTKNIPFASHFQNELSFSVSMYVSKYCNDNFDEMGTKSHYDLSTWCPEKISDLQKANSENAVEITKIKIEKSGIKEEENSESFDFFL